MMESSEGRGRTDGRGRTEGRADPLAGAVRELAAAEVVAFAGVGLASQVLPVTQAYRVLESALPKRAEDVRPHLAWLLSNGAAAGKAYAATLLAEIDPAAARTAWKSLAGDQSEFTTFVGCIMNRTTLAAYAAIQLDTD